MNRKLRFGFSKKIAKQVWACLLTVSMVSGMTVSGFPVTAFASTELQDDKLPASGACESTLYQFNQGTTFDIQGLKYSTTTYPNGILTTYRNNGYTVAISENQNTGATKETVVTSISNGVVKEIRNLGMELKISITPSKDNKYLLVDYYVYNKSGIKKTLFLGTGADIKIGNDDSAKCYKTSRGFHMVNKDTKEVFDCITNDPSLGVTPVDTRYVGNFGLAVGNSIFKDDTNPDDWTGDSGIAYSWKFDIRPYETVHRRVAFSVRASSYYVSNSGDDSNQGTYQEPFRTIDKAMEKISTKGYIFLMDDVVIDKTYTVQYMTEYAFASSDFDIQGNPTAGSADYVKTISRDDSFPSEPLFKLDSGYLRFTDLIVDGQNIEATAPLVEATGGRLEINSGTVFQNCKNISETQGGAIDCIGGSTLSMSYSTVQNIISGKKGAVHFNSGGTLDLLNPITMSGNVNGNNKPSNICLGTGKYITIQGDLGDSVIGVATEQMPAPSVEGAIQEAGQEVKIAVAGSSLPSGTAGGAFADNFVPDGIEPGGKGLQISTGTASLGNGADVVLRRLGYMVNYLFQDEDTGGVVAGAPIKPDSYYGVGDSVSVPAPASITGYDLKSVAIQQGATDGLSAVGIPGADFGKIAGTMPGQDVTVTYLYGRKAVSIGFVANGGTPQPEAMTGGVGSPITAILPQVSRYGYIFKGWSSVNSRENPAYVTALPPTYPSGPITYYAIFQPDNTVMFQYTVNYANQSGSVVFQSGSTEHPAEDALSSGRKYVKGYTWSQDDSVLLPSVSDYDGSGQVSTGSFQPSGDFTGKMPNQDMVVTYVYKVDRTDENSKSTLRIKHVLETGAEMQAPVENKYFPEDPISASPISKYGYQVKSGTVTAGSAPSSTGPNLTSGVTGSFDGNYVYTGSMPNQTVEITYVYEVTDETYPFIVTSKDKGAVDESLKKIRETSEDKKAESRVTAVPKNFYGYGISSGEAIPADGGIFDNALGFTGNMPMDSLQVVYSYDRERALWKTLTYKAGERGLLNLDNGTAADVRAAGAGVYEADVLINDQSSQGQTESYTLKKISELKLTPNPAANPYYRFGGWFLDGNQDGILNNGETCLPDDYRFTSDETVTAYFEKDPNQWYEIRFAAGGHGTLNPGESTVLNVEFDKKWGTIPLPNLTPEVNYLFDKWYDGDRVMKAGDSIQRGHTYTARFYPDPAVFGTDVGKPDVQGMLNDDGKGRITVYQTNESYQYILTDRFGKILAVKTGSIVGGSAIFDNLSPGENYLVYEAERSADAAVGSQMGAVTGGTISDPSEITTPVVDQNYRIEHDEDDENKSVLVIDPADKDSDYAVMDQNGTVILTPGSHGDGWVTPKDGKVMFTGLKSNETYIVVAKPRGTTGITPGDKREEGSEIIADPKGNIQIPKFVVETINGKITKVGENRLDTNRYEEARNKDSVTVAAEDTDSRGNPFLYWKITVGAGEGLANVTKAKELTFQISKSSVVLTAYYDRPTNGKATVTDENRPGNHEFALNPLDTEDLEDLLTTPEDSVLINDNKADVTYKVIYKKNSVKATESNAVKVFEEGGEYENRTSSFTGAWGLEVDLERYVNGRKVGTLTATASNAEFTTYVQLDNEDADMLDYRVYKVETDPDSGEILLEPVSLDYDPNEAGGLFTFKSKIGARYLMIYSKAYRVYFRNVLETEHFNYYLKVRKGETPSDFDYEEEYGVFREYDQSMPLLMVDRNGLSHQFMGWSYKGDRYDPYKESKAIHKETMVYAYYKNNKGELDQARNQLNDAILAAIKMSDDYFLKKSESAVVKTAIAAALELFEKTNPKATAEELKAALDQLRDLCRPYEEILEQRYDNYGDMQDSGSSGGHGGGGGSGSGSKGNPFVPTPTPSYAVGISGQWKQDPTTGAWKFVLTGGIELKNQWALLTYSGADANNGIWYHFEANGNMSSGWFKDETSSHNYYLDPVTGAMATGWKNIDGVWYYFTSQTGEEAQLPVGAMYMGKTTPDGYQVGADGVWNH